MLSLCQKEEAHFMKERIKLIRNIIGISQSKFANSLLISRSAVCKMESGENEPSAQTIELICSRFGVNENWLRTGEGEMFIAQTKNEQIARMMADAQLAGEDSFKYRFLAAISEYTDEDWKDLERLLDKWYKGIGNCS